MRNEHIGSESVKAQLTHLIEVAHAAIRYGSHAAQRAVYIRLHLAPERADDIGIIYVL